MTILLKIASAATRMTNTYSAIALLIPILLPQQYSDTNASATARMPILLPIPLVKT